MGKRHSTLTTALHQWAARHTDLTDAGYKCRDGVRSFNTDARLEQGLARQAWPTRVTKGHLASHLAWTDVIYYRCRRGAELHPIMLDIDAHHGELDALELSDLMLALFPRAYREPSTNLKGFHIYPMIAVARTPRSLFNKLMGVLADALAAIAAENNYDATVEVKGLCSLLTPDKLVLRRGSLAKYPRPRNQSDLDRLVASPVFRLDDLSRIISLAPAALELDTIWAKAIRQHYGGRELPEFLRRQVMRIESGERRPRGRTRPRRTACCRDRIDQSAGNRLKGSVSQSPDAYFRMVHACSSLARVLGRVPEEAELLAFYEDQNLARGANGARRTKRARDAIGYCERTFDPALATGTGFSDARPTLIKAIEQHVRPEHHLDTCYPRRITPEDLALTLYVVERGSFRGQTECGNGSIEGMFRTLKAAGEIKRSSNRNKAIATKTILERAELITCSNAQYRFGLGYSSKTKEYVIGVKHPRHGEYISLLREQTASTSPRSPAGDVVGFRQSIPLMARFPIGAV